MRICQLNPFYFPYAGGIERRVRTVAKHLADQGHETHIVTACLPGSQPGVSKEGDVNVHRLRSWFPLRNLYNPPPVRTPGLGRYLRRLAPDVIDHHFRWSASFNSGFWRAHRSARVVTYHNTYGEGMGALRLASRLNDRLHLRIVRKAHRVVCVSRFVAAQLVDRGVPIENIRIIPNGIDLEGIDAVSGRPTTAPEQPYIVAVGRLVAVKGLEILIDAMLGVPEPIKLVIAGRGPLAGSLKKRAERKGVAERVIMTGWVEEDEKIRLLKNAVAYVHPARFESFPLSILEALAAGAPILAARVGGIPEVVGESGRLLGHEATEWVGAIAAVAGDERMRARMAAASRERARVFDWNRLTTELAGVYEGALDA